MTVEKNVYTVVPAFYKYCCNMFVYLYKKKQYYLIVGLFDCIFIHSVKQYKLRNLQQMWEWLILPWHEGHKVSIQIKIQVNSLPPPRLNVCLLVKSPVIQKNKTLHTLFPPSHVCCDPPPHQNVSLFPHRCHCSCCCLQCVWSSVWPAPCSPVRTHRWSSPCSPARYRTLFKCCFLPPAEMPLKARCTGNVSGIILNMYLVFSVSHQSSVCVGGEWSVCVLRAHSVLLHHRGGDPGPVPERWLSLSQTSAKSKSFLSMQESPNY